MRTRGSRNETSSAGNEETDDEREEKWVAHYSSNHQILLVGEGDFSFSLSLANAFDSASNICASSLDSYDVLGKKYKNALSNLEKLRKLGACLLHEVDATKMMHHTDLTNRKFDRIIFNFPHAGFHRKEADARMIRMHKNLVRGFFRSARGMLRVDGEIHVNHKTSAPFCLWNLEELASESSLALIQRVDFNVKDYPGYCHKRGDGSRCDEPFPLGKSSTFKFSFRRRAKVSKATKKRGSKRRRSRHIRTIPIPMHLQSTSDFNYPQKTYIVNQIPLHDRLRLTIRNENQYTRVLDRNGMIRTYPRNSYGVTHPERLRSDFDARYDVLGRRGDDLDRQRVQITRTSNGNLYYKHDHERARRSLDRQMLEVPRTLNGNLYSKHGHDHDQERVRHSLDRRTVEVPRTLNRSLHYMHEYEHVRCSLVRQMVEVPRTLNGDFYYKHGHHHDNERVWHSLDRRMVELPKTLDGSLHYMHDHELHHIGNSRLHLRRPLASMIVVPAE